MHSAHSSAFQFAACKDIVVHLVYMAQLIASQQLKAKIVQCHQLLLRDAFKNVLADFFR